MRHDLTDLIPTRHGHFRFESGHHGNLWLDLDGLFRRSRRLRPFAEALASKLARHTVAVVCGPLVGGAFLAQTVADILDIEFCHAEPFVPDEREALYPVQYRLPVSIRSDVRGKAVAVVDDVVNAGSAVRGAYTALDECGARVVAIGALVVLGTVAPVHFAERGVPLERLADWPNDLWDPTACPLCAAGVPLAN
ncbi:MAG: phosphoribosyltransferase family protein [Gemmataceae bacterium]